PRVLDQRKHRPRPGRGRRLAAPARGGHPGRRLTEGTSSRATPAILRAGDRDGLGRRPALGALAGGAAGADRACGTRLAAWAARGQSVDFAAAGLSSIARLDWLRVAGDHV